MTERQEAILAEIINVYRQAGQPISSQSIAKLDVLGVCTATIRSEMNYLEKIGYLLQLHTSGGRVPTDLGYRYFVDNLMAETDDDEAPDDEAGQIVKALKSTPREARELIKTVSKTLSELSGNLVITALDNSNEFYKIGLASLFEYPELQEFGRLLRITSFFDGFEGIYFDIEKELLKTISLEQNPIRLFIGRESPIKGIQDESVIFARYPLPGNQSGSLVMIGPLRMDYAKNIGYIRAVTETLTALS